MKGRRGTAGLAASPLLVGATTLLVTIVAVFLAYNANAGLPFIPTYDVGAELPSGAKLVRGNDVRVGGFRVGVVDEIETAASVASGGRARAIARVSLKLDKEVEPLAADSRISVRPRSALGLKYVEIVPGRSPRAIPPGGTLPLANASEPLEYEDLYSTFDPGFRRKARAATQGFGDAFAGRGASLNAAIAALRPFTESLEPVMRNLADGGTELDRLFVELGRAAAQAAPVAAEQAELFSRMADTFAALSRDEEALASTIELSPPAIEASIRSFRTVSPFFAELAHLSRRLRPGARELPRSLPRVEAALASGTRALPATVPLNGRLKGALGELRALVANPATLVALHDVRTALAVTRPAVEFIAPYQTVCNFGLYFFTPLGEHQSQLNPSLGGTIQNQGVKTVNPLQPNHVGSTENARPWDVPPDKDPRGATDEHGEPLGRLYGLPYMPAIDAQGNADCQNGQVGWIKGPLGSPARYAPGYVVDANGNETDIPTGGNYAVFQSNFPILSGGTYKSRELGIENLADVP